MKLLDCIKKSAILLVLALIGATAAFSQNGQIINPGGGTSVNLDDGLKFVVLPNGSIHVFRQGLAQYCCGIAYPANPALPSSYTGTGVAIGFRFERGGQYFTGAAPNNSAIGGTSMSYCSTTPATQDEAGNWTCSISGTVTSLASGYPFYVTMNISYTPPNNYFTVDYFVRTPANLPTPETVHLYLSHDAYILGNDASKGYITSNATGQIVGDYRDPTDTNSSCTGGGAKVNPRYPSQHGFKTSNTFRSYFTGAWDIRNNVGNTIMLANTLRTTCGDDGVAVEFTIGPLAANEVGVARILHCYGNNKTDFDNTPVGNPSIPSGNNIPVTVNLAASTFSEQEGNADHAAENIQITVSNGYLTQSQICNFTVSGGTAAVNTDYTYAKGFIIPAGDYTTPRTFTLNNVTIKGNTICNTNKTFDISIDNPDGCNDLILKGTTINQAVVTITDDDPLYPGSIGPATQAICINTAPASPLVSVTPASGSNGTYTYLWQSSTNGGSSWVNASGTNNTAGYTVGTLTQTTQFRRQVTSGCTVYSDPVTVTVKSCMIPVNPHIRGNIK